MGDADDIRDENERLRARVAQLEKRLARSEESRALFERLVDSSNEAIAVSDRQFRHVYSNPAHERLFGYKREELRERSPRDLCSAASRELVEREVRPRLVRGESWSGEIEARDRSGREFLIWSRADTIRDDAGELAFTIGLMHDVSAEKEAAAARQRLEARVQHLQRLESLGVLAGGIAHEFNNLLTGILGNAGLALWDLPDRKSVV